MKLLKPFITFLFLLITSITVAQLTPSTLELIVGWQYSKSKAVYFIDGSTGKLISKVDAKEPVFFVSIDKEQDLYYIQTRHFIYKGVISTGEIKGEQKVYEKEETIKSVNYDNMIIPSGINNKGEGLWTYNKELITAQKEVANTSNPMKQIKIYKKINKLMQLPSPFVLYGFEQKSFKEYGSFSYTDKYPFALQSDNSLWFNDIKQGKLEQKDLVSNKVIKSYDTHTPFKFHTKLKNFVNKGFAPSVIGGDLFSVTFYGTNPNAPSEALTAVCNNRLRRIVTTYTGKQSAAIQYPLSFIDSDSYIFAKTETTFSKPKPKQPEQPKIGAFGAKKKLKEYQAKTDAYLVEHQKWLDEKFLPENNNILFYKDKDLKGEPVFTIKGCTNAQIFNNTNAFVIKKDRIVMYDTETGSEKWSISL